MEAQLQLPYQALTEVATRRTIREDETVKYGRQTYFVDFDKLYIREGFNLRKEYLGIDELADSIEATGLTTPLVVDMLKDGTCYIEIGHRRYKALQKLNKRFPLKSVDLPGLKFGTVECFINLGQVDELTRIKRQYSSNNGEKYTPLELGELCMRLKTYFSLNQVQIAAELGMSRQNVKNMMILAEQPDSIKQSIKNKELTPTAAIDLSRKIKDSNERNNVIQEATKKGKVGTAGAKRIIGDKDLKEIAPDANISTHEKVDHFQAISNLGYPTGQTDKKEKLKQSLQEFNDELHKPKFDEGREEIQWCQNVIKNLDKVNTIISKLENAHLKEDVEKLTSYIHRDMENIRLYIHKNKKQ